LNPAAAESKPTVVDAGFAAVVGATGDLEVKEPKIFEDDGAGALKPWKGMKADELSLTGSEAVGLGLAGLKPNENDFIVAEKAKDGSEIE
jgi:hypothetical protein